MPARAKPEASGNESAIATLRRRDKTLARIIRRVGPCTLKPRKDYFASLCEAIVSQQLSAKVATTLCVRFRGLFPRHRPTPTRLLDLSDPALRTVGLSRQKRGYLRDLAAKFCDGTVPSRQLARMDDQAIIDLLTQVRGVGVWTAQMFLIFVLNRPDVLPVADLGLRRAIQMHCAFPGLPNAEEVARVAEPWRPHRSLATWYLWQSLDNVPSKRPAS